MIEYIKGKLIDKNPSFAVVECNGIAYLIQISLNTFSKINENAECKLLTHQVIREDAHLLFGFYDENERVIFRHLISVSGVGANTARMILSYISPDDVINSILSNNVAAIQAVKGIGLKTAQRIIVDLKDKIGKSTGTSNVASVLQEYKIKDEAVSALTMLGFNKTNVEKVIIGILKENSDINIEDLIKQALKKL